MRRAWLGVVFVGTVFAAFVCVQSGFARAGQQVPPPEPITQSDPAPAEVPQEATPAEPEQTAEEAPSPCIGMSAQTGRLPGVLSAVPRYASTYVLVVPERLADTIPNAAAPAVRDLHVGATAGTAAGDVARALGVTNVEEVPYQESAPSKLLEDVRDGKLDAAVLWAPLAGLGILELGLDGQVSLYTVDKPHPAPDALHAAATADPCAGAIADELDVSGVLPAELLMTVDIRDFLTRQPPKFDLAQAQEGGVLFNQTCARCHGADAVADPHGLAPVDLRLSIQRFSYPGFNYIVWNGRPAKSMPAFRGTLSEDQVPLIYQYLRARSKKILPATTPVPAEP
ncbi:MAG: c-type cytochrome [Acidobacteriota bacterium]